jgi:hypothetical protein
MVTVFPSAWAEAGIGAIDMTAIAMAAIPTVAIISLEDIVFLLSLDAPHVGN